MSTTSQPIPSAFRHLPRLEYCGLTIVLSHPSRFDLRNGQLLTANGGQLLVTDILYPLGITRFNCDIRLADTINQPLIKDTKVILLLGTKAMTLWLPKEVVRDNKIDNLRGSPYNIGGIIHITSYGPQDAVDKQNFESQFNPDMLDWLEAEILKKQEGDPLAAKRRKGMTLRSNYRFWLKKDVEKAVGILHNGMPPEEEPHYIIYPRVEDTCVLLRSQQDKFLYFDMETDIHSGKMTCFAFGYDLKNIHVVPLVLPDYKLAYNEFGICQILQALSWACNKNTLVAFNGASFDFPILAWKYKIPLGNRFYDPMIASHRCFPMVEKSLGHSISLWTHETYHKDEAQFAFGNREQAEALWKYCGKDVSGMIKVHQSIEAYAKTVPGLYHSIMDAMDCIYPYMLTSLQGISYRTEKVVDTMAENDRLQMAYLKLIEFFIGETSYKALKSKSKKAFPSSNPQCCIYFHEMLGYKVMERSKKTGKPSLGEKPMFKLKLAYDNPVIDLVLAYRKAAKETGTLKFIPFDINNTQWLNTGD